MAKTLYDKIWNNHVVDELPNGLDLLYIDRHLIHEVTSPQAFEGLALQNRTVWRPALNLAVPDHNVPTINRHNIQDEISRAQIEALNENCKKWQITEYGLNDIRQGIVHIIGPEQGATLPGMTLVCGDSHTSTHGAFATIAIGIGTSEVEHVLATQCLVQKKPKNMKIHFIGKLKKHVYAKDMILALIGKMGTNGGNGYALEYDGDIIHDLSMEARMTICNMSIEAGARCGLMAVDETTIKYVNGRPLAPKGDLWLKAVQYWKTLQSDQNAIFDRTVDLDLSQLKPQVSWGTSPEMVTGIDQKIPDPRSIQDIIKRENYEHALAYMGLNANLPIKDIPIDKIFIGSCTNSRIEDLRIVAEIVKGHKVAKSIKLAMIVPGSGLVKQQAEQEGLDQVFLAAGFEWRDPGCSMCLGMNPDRLEPGEHCASTSNRNFEGRQGYKGRTHLVSPAMAAAAAIEGRFVDLSV